MSVLVTGFSLRSYNKNVLKVFPYPITCTVLQFGVGSLLALSMWTLGLYPKPEISGETVGSLRFTADIHARLLHRLNECMATLQCR